MTDLPDDAIRVVLAAVVPCEALEGDGTPWCLAHGYAAYDCRGCRNNGTRVVASDVEIKLEAVGGEVEGISVGGLWREVPRG